MAGARAARAPGRAAPVPAGRRHAPGGVRALRAARGPPQAPPLRREARAGTRLCDAYIKFQPIVYSFNVLCLCCFFYLPILCGDLLGNDYSNCKLEGNLLLEDAVTA